MAVPLAGEPRADRPPRRPRRPRRRPAAGAARALVRRRPDAGAARRPLRGAVRLRARARDRASCCATADLGTVSATAARPSCAARRRARPRAGGFELLDRVGADRSSTSARGELIARDRELLARPPWSGGRRTRPTADRCAAALGELGAARGAWRRADPARPSEARRAGARRRPAAWSSRSPGRSARVARRLRRGMARGRARDRRRGPDRRRGAGGPGGRPRAGGGAARASSTARSRGREQELAAALEAARERRAGGLPSADGVARARRRPLARGRAARGPGGVLDPARRGQRRRLREPQPRRS